MIAWILIVPVLQWSLTTLKNFLIHTENIIQAPKSSGNTEIIALLKKKISLYHWDLSLTSEWIKLTRLYKQMFKKYLPNYIWLTEVNFSCILFTLQLNTIYSSYCYPVVCLNEGQVLSLNYYWQSSFPGCRAEAHSWLRWIKAETNDNFLTVSPSVLSQD